MSILLSPVPTIGIPQRLHQPLYQSCILCDAQNPQSFPILYWGNHHPFTFPSSRQLTTSHSLRATHLLRRPPPHQFLQTQVFPGSLSLRLRRSRYPKRSMLIRHNVIFVFWIRGLVVGRNVDELLRKMRGAVEFLRSRDVLDWHLAGTGREDDLLRRGLRSGVERGECRCGRNL